MKKTRTILTLLLCLCMALSACGAAFVRSPVRAGSSTPEPGMVFVHASVPESWQEPRAWAWANGRDVFDAWPGALMEKDGDWYRIQIPDWACFFIVNGNGGSIQTADLPIEPGREVWITVSEDCSALVQYESPEAAQPEPGTVFVHAAVPASWREPAAWAWNGERNVFDAWPGAPMEQEGDGYRIQIPDWACFFIVNGNGGSVQTADLPIEPGREVWITVSPDCSARVDYTRPKDFGQIPALAPAERLEPVEEWAAGEAELGPVPTEDNARVFYEIFVGSFSDSDGDSVGDLRGIIQRFDYLNDGDPASGKSLGVEGIWLTPIFPSPSYHKYDVTDYYDIDPSFGTMEDLEELAALCESRNVKLILDLPLNHTGNRNAWFKAFCEAHKTGDKASPYYDFYSWCPAGKVPFGRSFASIPGSSDLYECNFVPEMPELNFDNENVRQEMLKIARFYLDKGVDGFRFDAAKYLYFEDHEPNAAYWTWYMQELKKIDPQIYTVAEVWDSDAVVDKYLPALNCFNFSLSGYGGLLYMAALSNGVQTYTDYVQDYLRRTEKLRSDAMPVSFLTNHDMDRIGAVLDLRSGRMAMAASLYLLSPGSSFIYYGEELGMKGTRGLSGTDANRRLAMPWGDGDTVKDPPGSTESSPGCPSAREQLDDPGSLYSTYKRLILIRQANPEIARGEYRSLKLPDKQLGGFISTWKGKSVCVLHNTSRNAFEIDLKQLGVSPAGINAVIGQGGATLKGTTLCLDGMTSVVLR